MKLYEIQQAKTGKPIKRIYASCVGEAFVNYFLFDLGLDLNSLSANFAGLLNGLDCVETEE